MNRFSLIAVLIFFATVIITSCKKDDDEEKFESKIIYGLNLDNYPIVDGSTSTFPLNMVIACELLGIEYQWAQSQTESSWSIEPDIKKRTSDKFFGKVKSSQTHGSFVNLIRKDAELVLSARTMSPDEKSFAETSGVTLIETPIALDAFIFIVHPHNPITSLTIEQIQDIYTGKITNWKEVGGNDAQINSYARNPNSGSQELMELMVMRDLEFQQLPISPEIPQIGGMVPVFERVSIDVNAICYTIYYFKENILKDVYTKTIAIEGIQPNKNSIINNSFPLVADVYAIIRSDLDKSSMAYKVYEFLQTEAGKQIIAKSGYLPY